MTPAPAKRVERLQHVALGIVRSRADVAQETRLRHRQVIQIRQRELAQAEKPVGMARPLHVQIVAEIEGHRDLLAHQFVDDGPIVDPLDRHQRAPVAVEQPIALLHHARDIHRAHAVILLGEQKIVARLLVRRVDLQQHHVLRIVIADDSRLERRAICRVAAYNWFDCDRQPQSDIINLLTSCTPTE